MRLTTEQIKSAPAPGRSREARAKHNIQGAANWIIGGNENTLFDYDEDSEEYKGAKAFLADHDAIVKEVVVAATTAVYEEGFCGWGGDADKILRDINFVGRSTLEQFADAEVRKQGY